MEWNDMAHAYIFTFGDQYQEGFTWYLDYYNSIDEAREHLKPGWSVMKYCDWEWRY